jgi:hypothetical protein
MTGIHDRRGWPQKTTRDGEWFERSLHGTCRSIARLRKQCSAGVPIGFGNPWTGPNWFGGQLPIGSGAEQYKKIYRSALNDLISISPILPHSHLHCLPRPSTLPTMPKTKQTAQKSTGQVAKRKLIAPSTRVLRPRPSRSRGPSNSPQPIGDVEMAIEPTLGECSFGGHCDYLYNSNVYL